MATQAPRRPSARVVASSRRTRGPAPIKTLFTSTLGAEEDAVTKDSHNATRIQINLQYELEVCRKAQEKELHERRLKEMRELLKSVAQDDWRFTSADKLIGLH